MNADRGLNATDVVHLQEKCSDMILSVGGYWPPLAGSARILEELGELSEAFNQGNAADICEEAIDLFTIATAVANQYCVKITNADLRRSRSDILSKVNANDWIGLLAICAGRFARSILILENIKDVKLGGSRPVLATEYAALISVLNNLMSERGISLLQEGQKIMLAKAKRDSARFQPRFDPVAAPVLQRVRPIVAATNCPFANEASLWGCPDQGKGESSEQYLARAAATIERFASVTRYQNIDGLVLELPDSASILSIEDLAVRVNQTLRWFYAATEPDGDLFDRVLTESWQFSAFGSELFVLALSDIYPTTSSRFTFGVRGSYLLLQPEISFRSMKVPRRETKQNTRSRIRQAFADAGRDYNGQIVNTPFEAPRYVKPLLGASSPVRWWEK